MLNEQLDAAGFNGVAEPEKVFVLVAVYGFEIVTKTHGHGIDILREGAVDCFGIDPEGFENGGSGFAVIRRSDVVRGAVRMYGKIMGDDESFSPLDGSIGIEIIGCLNADNTIMRIEGLKSFQTNIMPLAHVFSS